MSPATHLAAVGRSCNLVITLEGRQETGCARVDGLLGSGLDQAVGDDHDAGTGHEEEAEHAGSPETHRAATALRPAPVQPPQLALYS